MHGKYNLLRLCLVSPLSQGSETSLSQLVLAPGEGGRDQIGNISKKKKTVVWDQAV